MILRASAVWLLLAALAIANGAFREAIIWILVLIVTLKAPVIAAKARGLLGR